MDNPWPKLCTPKKSKQGEDITPGTVHGQIPSITKQRQNKIKMAQREREREREKDG